MRKKEKIPLSLILLWPIAASLISVALNVNFFVSVLIFFVAPSIILAVYSPKQVPKAAIYATVMLLAGLLMDTFGHMTKLWGTQTMFPIRVFGLMPIEDLVLTFSLTFYIIMYYEHFLDKHITKKSCGPKLKYLILLLAVLMILIFPPVAAILSRVKYILFILSFVIMLIPLFLVGVKLPVVFAKIAKAGAYFFYLLFIYEIVALKLGYWYFFEEASFIGWVSIFNVSFPLEELIFWIMLISLFVLSYFEYFDDDCKQLRTFFPAPPYNIH